MSELTKDSSLFIKAQTWSKDSHSLFDYQTTSISTESFKFGAKNNESIRLYRNKQSSTVVASHNNLSQHILQDYQFLTEILIENDGHKVRLQFPTSSSKKGKKINSNQKLKTQESISSICPKQEETYIVVCRKEQANEQQNGYALHVGQSIKLGRVEYYVSQTCINGHQQVANLNPKINKFISTNTLTHNLNSQKPQEARSCKICLDDVENDTNFLFNPCKCSGSCGTVHVECLLHWIRIKVKKQVVGGTIHYNFQKFQCQVCKAQLPTIIETQSLKFQLLPIIKPKGNYLILQAACQKSKSVMMIQNIPTEGIKLGRGHQCQIRITDISVSRNHALIKYINDQFIILDNKSKFGTLVREDNLVLNLSKPNKGVQIGRTVLTFQLKKESL